MTGQNNSVRLSPIPHKDKERADDYRQLNGVDKECLDTILHNQNQTSDDNYQSKRFSLNRVTDSS